jgi:hypothetical protein
MKHISVFDARPSALRITPQLIVALLVAVAAGCVSVNRLREAEDSFNRAATTENTLRFNSTQPLTSGSDAPAAWSAARNGYASALLSLEKLQPGDEKSLRQDGLWGTTLTLKALCQWRLGQFQPALDSAAEAQKTASDQIYPRDRAVLAALPGLIKTDQAYNKILTNGTTGNSALLVEVEALLIGPNGAVANVQSARGLVDRDHPVQVFLIQSQLAAYRNYVVGQDRLNNHAIVPATHAARTNANAQLKDLDGLVKTQTGGQELINYWARLCALDLP